MMDNWESHNTWITHFDILGFKSQLDNNDQSLALNILKSKINDVLGSLESDIKKHKEFIDYQHYADTFIIYSINDKINDYPSLIRVSKNFILNCTNSELPVRGAISYGEVVFGHEKKIIIGKAFLEAHVYGEDQNWIGLILTPSASKQLEINGLPPCKHGFINRDIPLREKTNSKNLVFAYKFINGQTSYDCPQLVHLHEMIHFAPDDKKQKYINTIEFIKKHYTKTDS